MADGWLLTWFALGAAVSLAASWVLVTRLERIGARLGLSEALLGMIAALAADGPEVTSAITALVGGHSRIGAGVVIGSNVFNLAALLGLGALVTGAIALHRRVVMLEGTVAILIAAICVAVVVGGMPAILGVFASGLVLFPYVLISSGPHRRGWLPSRWQRWLAEAVIEEEAELQGSIDHTPAHPVDIALAIAAGLVVVGASIVMEQTASTLGRRHAVPEIVIGGIVLAAVTSLPNAVSAIYLAARGRGAASLSTALNSNALNVLAGLLLPGAIVGLGPPSAQTSLITVWYAVFTALVLAAALIGHGLHRIAGTLIVLSYPAFVVAVVLST